MANFLRNAVNSSKILSYFTMPDYSQDSWSRSIFFSVLDFLLNAPAVLLKRLFAKWKHAFDGSIFIKIVGFLADRMHIVVGLYLAVTMLVPITCSTMNIAYTAFLLFAVFALKTMISAKTALTRCGRLLRRVVFWSYSWPVQRRCLSLSLNFIIFYLYLFPLLGGKFINTQRMDMLVNDFDTCWRRLLALPVEGRRHPGQPVGDRPGIKADANGSLFNNMTANVAVSRTDDTFYNYNKRKTWLKRIIWAVCCLDDAHVVQTGSRAAWYSYIRALLFFWNNPYHYDHWPGRASLFTRSHL